METAKTFGMGKSYLVYQYIAYLCLKRYLLGKARWENKVVKCELPIFPNQEVVVYLIVSKRLKAIYYKYEISMPKQIMVYDKTIYVFASVVNDDVVFYGWITGEQLTKERVYHPVGETKSFYSHGRGDEDDSNEEKKWVNKWEHYGLQIQDLHALPVIKAQQELAKYF